MFGIRNIRKRLDLYRQEEKLKIDLEILKYKASLVDMAKKCHDDMAEYEHTYHNTMEERGIAIAKLEAKQENMEVYDKLLEEKDNEIKRLNKIVLTLSENSGAKIVK